MKNNLKVLLVFAAMAMVSVFVYFYVQDNLAGAEAPGLTASKVAEIISQGGELQYLDVRPETTSDFKKTVFSGEYRIPLEKLPDAADTLSFDKEIPTIVYSNLPRRSDVAVKILRNAGFNAFAVQGGIKALVKELNKKEQ